MTINAFGVNTPRPSPVGCIILVLLLIILIPVWLPLAVLAILAVMLMRLLGIGSSGAGRAAAARRETPVPNHGEGGRPGGNPPASEDIIDVKPLSDDK